MLIKSLQRQAATGGSSGVDVNPSLATAISNVICSMIMSVRFSVGDPQFKRFMDLIEEGFKLFEMMAVVNFLPFVKYLPRIRETKRTLSKVRKLRLLCFFYLSRYRQCAIQGLLPIKLKRGIEIKLNILPSLSGRLTAHSVIYQ